MEDRIFFNQSKYIKEMLKKFGLEDSKPTKTPMLTEIKLTKDNEVDSVDSSKYRENPKTTHLEAVKRIFRYIRGTSHLGLWYPKGIRIQTVVYADSDHAGDYVDRKSTSGICTFMGCCLTSLFAKKQTALAISSTEAEYVSTGKACQQALWMKQSLIDYGIRLDDVLIMCDNKGAIDLSKNPVQHSRTKHIEIRHHFLRENIQKGNISIEKVASEDNIAGLKPFLTLNEPICPRFVVEFYHSLEVKRDEELCPYIEFKLETFYTSKWSLNSLDDHPNSNFFHPKHDLVKKAITTPRTTQAQLLRDPNKLYIDDIHPDLKGWELFFKENFFCSIDKRNKVKACTAYMLYYLTIGRKFNFTLMIIYRMEEVINKRKGPMPFAMLLTRLHNHILTINPQAIVPIARFTFHEHIMDPLDISRNPSKEKGKKIASPSVISSSYSSSDDDEAPSFLEFYDELSDSEDLTKVQREKRGMFKCLNR
ncbi:hypothetical protein Tco_0969689 [Tanacetum coccineum]